VRADPRSAGHARFAPRDPPGRLAPRTLSRSPKASGAPGHPRLRRRAMPGRRIRAGWTSPCPADRSATDDGACAAAPARWPRPDSPAWPRPRAAIEKHHQSRSASAARARTIATRRRIWRPAGRSQSSGTVNSVQKAAWLGMPWLLVAPIVAGPQSSCPTSHCSGAVAAPPGDAGAAIGKRRDRAPEPRPERAAAGASARGTCARAARSCIAKGCAHVRLGP
jgi:hypothetical protein